jgi:hypothetical protein
LSAEQDRPTLWHRVVLIAVMPMLLQLYVVYWVFIWAEEDSSAASFYPLAALLLMIVALPVALVANVWVVRETASWRIYWAILVGYLQAMLIPVACVIVLLSG